MAEPTQRDAETARTANSAGLAAIRSGDAPGAITAFTSATAADPDAGALWRNLAHAHRLADDTAAERAALDRALAIDRTDFIAQLRLAQLHQRESHETAALVAWSGAQQLAAQLPERTPQIEAELAAGESYCAGLRVKLASAADAAISAKGFAFEETDARRIRSFVDLALGRRQVFHNVCAGAYFPFLPADEYFDSRHFPWFAELEAGAAAVKQELADLLADPGDSLRPYVRMETGTPPNTWTALDGSLDWAACFLWEYGVPNPAVIARCPKTADLLDKLPLARIPGRAPNAFFSLLKPGRRIPPHTGVTNTRAIVHLALDVPPGCGFRVGGETREWVEGKAFAFDDTIEHEAWNTSDRQRAVLIIDTWNPHLSVTEQQAIVRYFDAADAALAGPLSR